MLEPAMPCVPQYQQLALQICLGCQHCQWAEGFSTSRPAMFDPRWHGPTPSCISKQLGSSSSYAAQKAVCANSPTSPVLSRTPRPKVQIEDVHQPKGAFARVEPARGRATPPSQAGRRQSPALSRAQFSSCARFRRPRNVFNSIFNTRAILRRPAAPQSALPPPSAPAANLRPTFTPTSRKPWFRSHDCGCRPGMGRGFRWGCRRGRAQQAAAADGHPGSGHGSNRAAGPGSRPLVVPLRRRACSALAAAATPRGPMQGRSELHPVSASPRLAGTLHLGPVGCRCNRWAYRFLLPAMSAAPAAPRRLSLDGGATRWPWEVAYRRTIVASGARNPNGCRIPMTW